jgi:amidase
MSGQAHHFQPQMVYYTFGPHPPVLHVRPGDRITTATVDARNWDSAGREVPMSQRQPSLEAELRFSNPQIGPFYVEGAEPGDTLVVRILDIALNREWGWSALNPGFGGLVTESRINGPTGLNEPLPEQFYRWELDLKRLVGRLELPGSRLRAIEIPLHPFLGCIGVAPPYGQFIFSMAPAEHGGNMDSPETCVGATVYLPVFVRGAYLFFGDVHAAQGDGETGGSAVETTADVTVEVDLQKGKRIRWPRFENQDYIMVAGSARPLIDAFRIAHVELIDWLAQDYGFDRLEALQVVTQVGSARIGNVVDPNYTVVARFPKKYLPC